VISRKSKSTGEKGPGAASMAMSFLIQTLAVAVALYLFLALLNLSRNWKILFPSFFTSVT
jgi:hypothetical protein